jgi:sugar lactone lactonase YvrE
MTRFRGSATSRQPAAIAVHHTDETRTLRALEERSPEMDERIEWAAQRTFVRAPRRLIGASLVIALMGCGTSGLTPTATSTRGPTAVASVPPSPSPGPTAEVVVPPSVTPGEALEELWTYESTPASYAWAPAIDPEGRIWVASLGEGIFWVVDRDGNIVENWGDVGEADGQISIKGELGSVFGSIAFAPDGSFVVGDGGNHRVQRFDAEGDFLGAFGEFGTDDGQFVTISGVTFTPDGNIVVVDNDREEVQIFEPDGTYLRTICRHDSGALAAVDADGVTWCLDADRLEAWDASGSLTRIISLGGVISLGVGLTIGPNGHVYVASVAPDASPEDAPERLLELDADGTLLHVWPTGGEGIAIDPAGNRIYIGSIDLRRVRAYALPQD